MYWDAGSYCAHSFKKSFLICSVVFNVLYHNIVTGVILLQIFQYDMWHVEPTSLWDWAYLKHRVAEHGVRNSLLLAPMPTASTAQILGNNESFEPYTTNIYTRRVLSGEFQVSIEISLFWECLLPFSSDSFVFQCKI